MWGHSESLRRHKHAHKHTHTHSATVTDHIFTVSVCVCVYYEVHIWKKTNTKPLEHFSALKCTE